MKCFNKSYNLVRTGDEDSVEDDHKMVEEVQVHTNLRLDNNDEKAEGQDNPMMVKLTRLHPQSNQIHIRLAKNLNYHIYWNER